MFLHGTHKQLLYFALGIKRKQQRILADQLDKVRQPLFFGSQEPQRGFPDHWSYWSCISYNDELDKTIFVSQLSNILPQSPQKS